MKIKNVLSLFDGMSCGRIALDRAGIEIDNYYACELDKHAIQVTQANWPETVQLGDVTKWLEWDVDWGSIDLLIGGSPCQGFSFAGKQLAFDDPRSALFFEYVNILRFLKAINPNIKFMLENVKMKKDHLDVISKYLGVEPVFINSSLVSAQNRQRYYWANWEFGQPEDKGVLLKDIIQEDGFGMLKNHGVFKEKSDKANCVDANYHKGLDNHGQRTVVCAYNRNDGMGKGLGKTYPLNASDWRDLNRNQQQNCVVKCGAMIGRKINPDTGKRDDYNSELKAVQRLELRGDEKTNCLTSVQKDNYVVTDAYYRKLTPIECERLQTVPDNYTNHVSNTQRYKMLGNGWTVDVIAHIFRGLL